MKQLAVDAQAAIVADSADNIATCPATADGNAIIEADVTALDYQFVASKKCILTVYNPNPGKKVMLTLPVAFGGVSWIFFFFFKIFHIFKFPFRLVQVQLVQD